MPKFSRRQRELRAPRHQLELAIVVESLDEEYMDSSDEEEGDIRQQFCILPPTAVLPELKQPHTMKGLSELYFLAHNSRYLAEPNIVTPKSDDFVSQYFHICLDR